MAKKLLGLRLCEHDSNLSLYDGSKVHYLKTERLHKQKHHAYNNLFEWRKDLEEKFNIKPSEITEIAIVVDPWIYNLPVDKKEFYPANDFKHLPVESKVYQVNHHLCHALSCWPLYKTRPKYEIIIDGFGDANNAWTVIIDNKIYKRGYTDKNGSLGLAMAEVGKTFKIDAPGQQVYDIAGKLMGLQSYGNLLPEFKKFLNYDMYSINRLFNFDNYSAYKENRLLAEAQPLDWIRTVHDKISDILINFFEEITNKDYDADISYSGGVAQNVIWNTALKNKFKNLIIPPHCNDEGLSLGALEYLRVKNNLPKFKLDNFPYVQSDETPDTEPSKITIEKTAEYLKQGYVVAWYQGKGEIGPRALGNRSLLLNPLINNGKNIINRIKKREAYRPFGASILKEHVKEYFNTDIENPHMLYVGDVKQDNLQSITHVDKTCRFQGVDKSNKIYYQLLNEFYKKTGCPLILNTSLNINGKPIMSDIKDAIDYFNNSKIDILVIGNKIYKK
jgi:carbamoyltransferase